ncbi:hypothetical protein GGR54DRAFT_460644 [Hypoxylon sp. NC1633]|nr:hypothetical protein GGR54DRAFT_460644 [Hypoxylon sp. NC1633]
MVVFSGYTYTYFDDNGRPIQKTVPPQFETDAEIEVRFQREVLAALHKGDNPYHQWGLDQLRGGLRHTVYSMLDDDTDPFIYVFTPEPAAAADDPTRDQPRYTGEYRYPDKVMNIESELYQIFGYKAYRGDTSGAKVNGKILVQYKPAPNCYGLAQWRIWFEGELVNQKAWNPLELFSKRDNSTACDISEVYSGSTSASVSSTSAPPTTTPTPIVTPTATTTTAPSSTGLQVTAPTSPTSCYNSLELGCYDAVALDTAHSKSEKFCTDYASIDGFSGPNWPGIQSAFNDFSGFMSYDWRVSWKPGCVGQDKINVGQPITAFSCQDAMRLILNACNKDKSGRGGTVTVGCLVYDFSLGNLDGGSCSLPFS